LLPGSDDDFQELLLRLSARATDRVSPDVLIEFFCRAACEVFRVAGVYFWRCHPAGELVGEQAYGKMSQEFIALRMRPEQSAVTADAVRQRRTTFLNHLNPSAYPPAMQFDARSMMAAPLLVLNEVVGVVCFLHDADEEFFNADLAAKATIAAAQLGSLIEAARFADASREEHHRAGILAEVPHGLHGKPDVAAVLEALADRLRTLLRTRLVCVLVRRDGSFDLQAVSGETPEFAASAKSRHDRQTLRFAADLAQRAIAAGEPLTLSIGADVHSLGSLVSPGMLLAAPFRTSRTQGAILIYPRQSGLFTSQERALVTAIVSFGAVAMAHAELHGSSDAHAQELDELLEISSELGSSGDLEHFLRAFVTRAAAFLGFGRSFIALLQDDQFRVRYAVELGEARRADTVFPEGIATKAVRAKEVFWTDEAGRTPGANLNVITKSEVQHFLAVPLLGGRGKLLGMLGVLDRLRGAEISQEDIRRARALSNQAAIMLESVSKVHSSDQHRRQAEALIELARDIHRELRLPEFGRFLVNRTAELTDSHAGLLAVRQEGNWKMAAVCQPDSVPLRLLTAGEMDNSTCEPTTNRHAARHNSSSQESVLDHNLLDRNLEDVLGAALSEFLVNHPESVIARPAEQILGTETASHLGWSACTLVRIPGANDELAAVLCLSRAVTSKNELTFLESMAGHAAVALQNSRLFTRIEQSNRHSTEMFDAITDFIVVHDQADKVICVNRSLAAMIGVPAAELVGVNMRALMALTSNTGSYSCPFCRVNAEDSDEFAHPVFDRTYLVSTSRLHGGLGEGLQTVHVLKDISDRREAERRYRELFDNIQEGLFFSTPDGRFIEVNDAMVRMLGYGSREELLQINIRTQLYFSPEHRDQHARLMEEHGGLRNLEATLRRKDGSPIHVLINAFALHDSAGKLLQIRGLMLDVTGLRTYQSELHRERDFSSKILSNTQSFILVADTAGLISYANKRWYDSGFDQGELIGRPLVDLAAPGYQASLADAVQSTLDNQQTDNLEVEFVRRNGPAGRFSANLSPMRDEQGIVTSIVAVLTDITDSAVLRDKLVHTEKMAAVGQLVSGVAHEVNNPLTAILGFADLLMENPEVPDTARKDLRVILQEAQRTKQIVQNLLSFARQMPPQRKPLQLNSILRRTTQLRAYDFNSHGVEVIEHLDEALPEVIGDAHQLQQVFLNILNNAYDAVHECGHGARIEIISAKCGDFVEVSFADNGKGISYPDRIFDPFFTTKEVGKGTGLGLSICYGILKEHGGEVSCHNNVAGQGATFIVRLPVAAEPVSLGVAAGVTQP
jgi:PAS domain S-box-containing protein